MSFMMPHLVDITGTSQKSDSNKTFGEPSLSDEISNALAFEKRSATLFDSGFN